MASHLLVLGGGSAARPVLQWAREAGLSTSLVDPDPRARCRALAERFHQIPLGDVEGHAALARRLARTGLAGVLATDAAHRALQSRIAHHAPRHLPARTALEQLQGDRGRAALERRGFPVAPETWAGPREIDVFGYFRDGAFVPGGTAARESLPSGDVLSLQPAGLGETLEQRALVLLERAARDLGLAHGPLQATLVETDDGLAFQALTYGLEDLLGSTWVARRAYGKSVVQAWVAHLAGAGGPFDELPSTARQCAGWLALMPARAGLYAGVDGIPRARAVAGDVEVAVGEPGRELASPELEHRPLGHLWAEAPDEAALRERLLAARDALEVRIAGRQRVA